MLLLGYAERFKPVSRSVATPPYPAERKVPYCESDAYVWVTRDQEGAIDVQFAIGNPSGISAKALAAILREGLKGTTVEEVATMQDDIVERIFRQNLSMGKGMGLTAMVRQIAAEAKAMNNAGADSPKP